MRYASIAMVAPLALALVAGVARPAPAGEHTVTWISHATFEFFSPGGTTLLLDPYDSFWPNLFSNLGVGCQALPI